MGISSRLCKVSGKCVWFCVTKRKRAFMLLMMCSLMAMYSSASQYQTKSILFGSKMKTDGSSGLIKSPQQRQTYKFGCISFWTFEDDAGRSYLSTKPDAYNVGETWRYLPALALGQDPDRLLVYCNSSR